MFPMQSCVAAGTCTKVSCWDRLALLSLWQGHCLFLLHAGPGKLHI